MTRRILLLSATVVSLLPAVLFGADSGQEWIALFGRYAAQKEVRVESPYGSEPVAEGAIRFSEVLRALPPPDRWPELRRRLAAAEKGLPANDTTGRARLHAAGWLLDYLTGQRQLIADDLARQRPGHDANSTRDDFLLQQLGAALHPKGEESGEAQLQSFETELEAVEPINEDRLRKMVGGAENWEMLKKFLAAMREYGQRAEVIGRDYDQNHDEAKARAAAEALRAEFETKWGRQQKTLEPYFANPAVQKYVMKEMGQSAGEETEIVPEVSAPDLVHLLGKARAETLLRRALLLPVRLDIGKGPETQRLARELALALGGQLKTAQWGLVTDLDSVELYELLRSRFPQPDQMGESARRTADAWYLAGLIARNRIDDALKLANTLTTDRTRNLPSENFQALREQQHGEALWDFLAAWLPHHPGSEEWTAFNELSVELGRLDRLAALRKHMFADGSFSGLARLQVQVLQADSELAADQIPAAIDRLRAFLAEPAEGENGLNLQLQTVSRLITLGALTGDNQLLDTAIAGAERLLEAQWKLKPGDYSSKAETVISALNERHRPADAARVGRVAVERISEIEAKRAAIKKNMSDPATAQATQAELEKWGYSSYEARNILAELFCAEVDLGAWAEAGELLQKNPSWQAADLRQILRLHTEPQPLAGFAARWAQHQGDLALARRILVAQIVDSPGRDAPYADYLALAGNEAVPLLDALAASDRYEERPLIWKAELRLKAGDPKAALALLQQAVTIDPSDGEEGRGDRMRAYAELSETWARLGDQKKADFFAGVVKAIRLSETADQWFEVGAFSRAIALYEEALGFFRDAYCVQSRLAIRLAKDGRMDEALVHYRRAYELMPGSFGQVESHCFGCEKAFAGAKQQAMAEQVFLRMKGEDPGNPRVRYLLGYLREEEERPKEAAAFYREAIKLDPLYLNAWKKLTELGDGAPLSAAEKEELAFKLLELDPAGRHSSPQFTDVTDLARLWRAMAKAREVISRLPASEKLLPLTAAAATDHDQGTFSTFEDRPAQHLDFARQFLERDFANAFQNYLAGIGNPHADDMHLDE